MTIKAEIKIMVIPEKKTNNTSYRKVEVDEASFKESRFTIYADGVEELETKLNAISKLV